MKVAGIYKTLCLVALGFILGAGTSTYVILKHMKNNTPAGQEITIGKLKIRGNNNTDIIDIDATNEQTELSKREQRRLNRGR